MYLLFSLREVFYQAKSGMLKKRNTPPAVIKMVT
jgi:hypothetical protein